MRSLSLSKNVDTIIIGLEVFSIKYTSKKSNVSLKNDHNCVQKYTSRGKKTPESKYNQMLMATTLSRSESVNDFSLFLIAS